MGIENYCLSSTANSTSFWGYASNSDHHLDVPALNKAIASCGVFLQQCRALFVEKTIELCPEHTDNNIPFTHGHLNIFDLDDKFSKNIACLAKQYCHEHYHVNHKDTWITLGATAGVFILIFGACYVAQEYSDRRYARMRREAAARLDEIENPTVNTSLLNSLAAPQTTYNTQEPARQGANFPPSHTAT